MPAIVLRNDQHDAFGIGFGIAECTPIRSFERSAFITVDRAPAATVPC
jgi:hypothetical protein